MRSALLLVVVAALSTLVVASHVIVPERRQSCDPNGWVQNSNGRATFTSAHNCATPCKCRRAYFRGFTSAINELTFGSDYDHSFGDACGRCFHITSTADPFDAI